MFQGRRRWVSKLTKSRRGWGGGWGLVVRIIQWRERDVEIVIMISTTKSFTEKVESRILASAALHSTESKGDFLFKAWGS